MAARTAALLAHAINPDIRPGLQFRAGFKNGDKREVITIYEVCSRFSLVMHAPYHLCRMEKLSKWRGVPYGPLILLHSTRAGVSAATNGTHRALGIHRLQVKKENGKLYVVPDYSFRFAGGPTGYAGPTTPCATASGSMPRAAEGYSKEWSDESRMYSGKEVPCVNGTQTWSGEQGRWGGVLA